MKILVEPKNAITKQYEKLLAMEGVKLVFERDALEAIAQKACDKGTGARGLRSIVEAIMVDAMFEIPSTGKRKFDVTAQYAREKFMAAHFDAASVES